MVAIQERTPEHPASIGSSLALSINQFGGAKRETAELASPEFRSKHNPCPLPSGAGATVTGSSGATVAWVVSAPPGGESTCPPLLFGTCVPGLPGICAPAEGLPPAACVGATEDVDVPVPAWGAELVPHPVSPITTAAASATRVSGLLFMKSP
jgi:hypothetical protein